MAYTFVRAFQVTGNEHYLDLARHALTFLYEKGWDAENGGWWFTVDETGQVAPWLPCDWWDPNLFKWTYAQTYPLVGIGAMLEATIGKRSAGRATAVPSGSDADWYQRGLAVLDDHLWDGRASYLGYYESAGIDWTDPIGKGFTGTVDGIATHGAPAALLSSARETRRRFRDLADVAYTRLVGQIGAPGVLFGFPEGFDADWNVDPESQTGDIGHVLKTAWSLGRAFLAFGNPAYRDGSTRAMRAVLDGGGYDFVNGGPFLSYNWFTGEVTHGKNHWMLEQGVLAGLLNWHVATSPADRQDGLMMADQSLDFFTTHMMDWELGGHFFETDDSGAVTNALKGDVFEQGYHTTELAYFAYLYGSVFLNQEPFSLYYHFAPSERTQVVRLEPAEFEPGTVRITEVQWRGRVLRGAAFGSTLVLPPRVGGKIKVTFAPSIRRVRCAAE